jgi:hypothetical protein
MRTCHLLLEVPDWGNKLLAVAVAFGNLHGVHTGNEKLGAQSGPSCLPMTAVLPLALALTPYPV